MPESVPFLKFFFHTPLVKSDVQARQILVKAGDSLPSVLELALTGAQSRAEVRLERGTNAVIFDTSTSSLHTVTVTLEPESTLTYVSLSSSSARRFTSTVKAGARIHWHCTTTGGADHSLVSTCTGENAVSDIDWIFAVRGTERQSVDVRNVFAARNGGGEITLKGVASEQALAVCHGMIEITEEGNGTDTYLTEDVLMLNSTAKVDAIPGLEIRTNDVKASHSATVSRVTAEDLFYFQSRGIDADTARSIFVEGFLLDLTERIVDASIRLRIEAAISSAASPR